MNTKTKHLEQARAQQRAMREAGAAPERLNPIEKARRNPKSRALALRAYYWDWVGCADNPCTQEMREEAAQRYDAARTGGLVAAIQGICFECVGGDADPGPKLRVRDCARTDCPLRAVRPWQGVRSRSRSQTADTCAE